MDRILTGGCQCGQVRFRVEGPIRRASLCHCRMCQRATGGPFGVYANFATASVFWTRGERSTFQSSAAILRGFCRDCGTPLTFEAVGGGKHIAIMPQRQLELDARLPWVATLAEIPGLSPEEEAAAAAKYPPAVSRQHPDHDTEACPFAIG